jgi:Domain of unknown function (DUF4214)
MITAIRRTLAARLFGASLLTGLAGFLAQPARADVIWGANGHPFTAYDGVSTDTQLGFLKDLGLKSYRVNISNIGSAGALDALIRKAEPLGITILPLLTPALDLDALAPDDLRRQAHDFAFALVSQFKDRIKVYELGNELEVYAIIKACEKRDDGTQYNCNWGPAGGNSALDYYGPRWEKVSAVMKGLSEGTIAADSSALKAMGTGGWGHTGAFERMRRDGVKWDISVWHMFGEDPEWAFKLLAGYGKPIWVTEMSHPRGSEPGERQQANGLRRSMERLAELSPRYKVEAVHVYELMDETYWAPSFEAVMGLVRLEKAADSWRPGAPKLSYDAVRAVVRGEEGLPIIERGCAPDRMLEKRPQAEGQVAYLHCVLLGRETSEAGLCDLTAKPREGMSIAAMVEAIVASPEFMSRYRIAFLSDERFLTVTYRLLLGRDPDGQGRNDYLPALQQGRLTRIALMGALASSGEFKQRHRMLFEQS